MSNTPTLLRRSQLGELLVREGKLTREELAAALAYREERGLKLGQALVALHLVTQQDLAGALRSQGRVHCLELTPGIVDPEIARRLPEAMARKYVAVPVHRVAGRVTVAMEDPAEEYDVDAIASALGEPIFAVHADPERIFATIGRIFDSVETRDGAHAERACDPPRFTLVRGPLPETDADEAAELLVRAALREARRVGAESFHVESTARGAEMSFRVDGARTPAAVLPPEWAEASARALLALVGATTQAQSGSGALELDGADLEVDVATLAGFHGRCARATLRARPSAIALEHLPLAIDERASIQAWLAASGLVLVVGSARAGCDALAGELAARAAAAGRRVYRLGAPLEGVDLVAVARGSHGSCGSCGSREDLAADLRALGEQSPDVVEIGAVAGSAAWCAAFELARSGMLVIARADACDGASALAAALRACGDAPATIALCAGTVALCDVRPPCAACRARTDADDCTACGGTGRAHAARIAEVLDFRGALGEHLERDWSAAGIRAAACALGLATLADRARAATGTTAGDEVLTREENAA